jgi:hypothetical protein
MTEANEILGLLLGVFGTIVGFYFGGSGKKPPPTSITHTEASEKKIHETKAEGAKAAQSGDDRNEDVNH